MLPFLYLMRLCVEGGSEQKYMDTLEATIFMPEKRRGSPAVVIDLKDSEIRVRRQLITHADMMKVARGIPGQNARKANIPVWQICMNTVM